MSAIRTAAPPMEISFFVSGEPIPAPRPRVMRRGTYLDPHYVAWRDLVAWTAGECCRRPLEGPVVVALTFWRSRKGRADLDNLIKGVLDGLSGIAFQDDTQVVRLMATKAGGCGEPGVAIRLWDEEAFEEALVEATARLVAALVREEGEEADEAGDPGEHFMDEGRYGYDHGPGWG